MHYTRWNMRPCAFFALLLCLQMSAFAQSARDSLILAQLQAKFADKQPTITDIASTFIGTPYAAGRLNVNATEQLVAELDSFDCVTFVETVVALWRTSESNFNDYPAELQKIRYRNGRINGFASRLHYTTDWMDDNCRRGIMRNITNNFQNTPWRKEINFMTTHSNAYPPLNNDSTAYQFMQRIEQQLSRCQRQFVPKNMVEKVAKRIPDGAIIAITTRIGGLDCAHVGFAVKQNNTIHLLHASSGMHRVCITEMPLNDYLHSGKTSTGIFILMPQKP